MGHTQSEGTSSIAEDSRDCSNLMFLSRCSYSRFNVTKKSTNFQIELCAPTLEDKNDWMEQLSFCALTRKDASTPLMKLLNERHNILKGDGIDNSGKNSLDQVSLPISPSSW